MASPPSLEEPRRSHLGAIVLFAVVLIVFVIIALSAVGYFSTGNVRLSGSITSPHGAPIRVDFRSSSGQNYTGYANSPTDYPNGQVVSLYSVDLPNNAAYHVTVIETGTPTNFICDAGTIHVSGDTAAEDIVC